MRTVGIKLKADVAEFTRNMNMAGKNTREFTAGLEKADRANKLDNVTHAAAGLGLGLVGVAGVVTKFTMDFDKQMSAVQAATHASAGSMSALRAAAMKAGADTQYSATEAAKGIEELAKAGVSTSQILGGGLTGALSLAAAGQLDVGEAAETAASAMTQFGLSGNQVPHVADLLSAAAGKAQGSVHDMGMALNQGGLVAAQMGVSIEETTGTLAAFASAGLMGSDAGTSFKQSLLQLANPSDKAASLMEELGLRAYDAQGNFIGMAALAGQLQEKLGGLTQEQRNSALATIFGSDAIRAANVLYQEGAAGITAWTDKTNDAGYAAETAAMKTDNLAGDVERLTGSLETLAIQSGSGANGGLRLLAQGANGLVDQFAKLSPLVGGSITVLAALSGGALLLGVGWLKARTATADMLTELRNVGPVGERAAAGIDKTRKAAGLAAGAFIALQVATAVVSNMQDELNPQLDALATGLGKYAQSAVLSGEASRLLGGDLGDLENGFKFLADGDNARRAAVRNMQGAFEDLIPGLAGTNTSLTRTRERVTALDTALAQMVQGGQAAQAKAAFDRLAAALAVNGVSMEEFRKQFPAYAGAMEVANGASKTGAAGIQSVGAAAAGATDKIEAESKAVQELSDKLRAQVDPAFALISAQDKLAEAQKAAAEAIRKHGRNSVEAREATRNLASAALDLQAKATALGGSFNAKVTPELYATLRAAGLTEGQIKNVGRELGRAKTAGDRYAKEYKANVSAPGAKQAKTDLDHAYTAANHYAGPYRATVSITGDVPVARKLAGLMTFQDALRKGVTFAVALSRRDKVEQQLLRADGGAVYGPGTGTSDSIPARLSNNEHVWTEREVVGAGGHQQVERLRRLARAGQLPPGFAAGGAVTWPYPATASMTRIPSVKEAAAAVTPAAPSGGQTWRWIIQAARALVPGVGVISTVRPGATTLSGSRSYHAIGRAVDFSPSMQLARAWNQRYGGKTKEEITPWRQYDLWNGSPHHYSAALHAQHSGGNAHVHIAMGRGGTIREPILGVGRSGATYSFGENYQPERVTPVGGGGGAGTVINVSVQAGYVVTERALEDKIAATVDNLVRKGRI